MLWTEDQTQKRVPIEAAITNKALRIYEKKIVEQLHSSSSTERKQNFF